MGEADRGFWGGVLPFIRVEFLDSFAFLLFFRGKRRFFVWNGLETKHLFRGGVANTCGLVGLRI